MDHRAKTNMPWASLTREARLPCKPCIARALCCVFLRQFGRILWLCRCHQQYLASKRKIEVQDILFTMARHVHRGPENAGARAYVLPAFKVLLIIFLCILPGRAVPTDVLSMWDSRGTPDEGQKGCQPGTAVASAA
jgi:hypothetical protein